MMTSRTTTGSSTAAASRRLGQRYVTAILALAGTSMVAAGIWAGAAPRSFARCHRPRIPDRVVFDKLIQMLVFGCGYRRIADATCYWRSP